MDNKKNEVVVGITQGDPNGVGLELIIRTFADENIFKYFTPVVYASPKAFVFYKKILNMQEPMYHLVQSASEAKSGKLNLVVSSEDAVELKPGTAAPEAGREALKSLDRALADAAAGKLHALVTAPLDKSTVAENSPGFSGHTGYIASKLDAKNHAMLLVNDELRVALVTEHVPVSQIASNLSTEKIEGKIRLLNHSLREDFGFVKPRIAVLGLNPHAGDGGLLGKEEESMIKPAIAAAFKDDLLVYGPYSSDAFFGSGAYHSFDGILAMYHDQGLIPFKTFAFYEGVNYTAGLNIVRTSPDHGTAYDLAGKGTAELLSFRNALFTAVRIVKNRLQWGEDFSDPLPYSELRREKFRIDF